ncbi:MAG: VOC family protein [Chitinophagales bacterium]
MSRKLAHLALVIDDYDEAIDYYTNTLEFQLLEDTVLTETKRWVLITPGTASGCSILLAKAANAEQQSRIGNQTGGRVFLFLHTNTFEEDFKNLIEKKVRIVRQPVEEAWGRVLVFEDKYGNLWDLIEKR